MRTRRLGSFLIGRAMIEGVINRAKDLEGMERKSYTFGEDVLDTAGRYIAQLREKAFVIGTVLNDPKSGKDRKQTV